MFFNSLKPFLNVKIKNSSFEILHAFRTVLRNFCSKSCNSKLALMDPDCKTAVITGGAEGIGFATAHQLLCDNARRVALIGNDTKKGLDAINFLNCSFGKSRALFFKCDVKNKTEVDETMDKVKGELEQIDIVVNAAGIWDDRDWQDEMQTNLAGTINITLAAKDLVEKGDGVIINLSGLSGLEPFPPSPLFATFAAGVVHFSRCFGHEANFKRFGVRTVVLCTGITKTDMLTDVDKRMLTKEMGKSLGDYLKKACCQKSEACAKAVVEVLKFGPSGSVWIVEGSCLYYLNVQDYKNCLNLVSQFV